MKKLVENLVKSTLVAVLVLGSSSIYAVGDVKVAPITGSKQARISVASNQNEDVRLTVISESGAEYLYSENLSESSAYNKVYDFKQLNEGNYKIVAESDSKIIEKNITVSKQGVEVVGEKEVFKPYFKIQDNKLLVSFLNDDESQVNVNFSNGSDVFFSDEKVSDLNFMKAYDLASLEKGQYTVSLNSGKSSYSYFFEVK